MSIRIKSSDLDICAATVAALASDQRHGIWACLAWMIRNRLLALPMGVTQNEHAVSDVCGDIVREALGEDRLLTEASFISTADRCRLYAVNSLVWAGDLDDETGGAIACHRHDKSPSWARSRTPTALLGPFLFFR
ncbi:MAG: hypothetical protein HC850_00205 [Rhodomicrobium sp.]|nr:hypothetical protein [Rhodomicrobium sp.]